MNKHPPSPIPDPQSQVSNPQSLIPNPSQVLVIGIGNEFRQDDGVGVAVARAIRAAALPGVEVCERSGEGTALVAMWSDRPLVYVIDAISAGAPIGTIHRFEIPARDPGGTQLPTNSFRGTSHQIGLGEAIELGRVLGQLPARLVVYGIEGGAFGEGVGLSRGVEQAVVGVVGSICSDLIPSP